MLHGGVYCGVVDCLDKRRQLSTLKLRARQDEDDSITNTSGLGKSILPTSEFNHESEELLF
jgi:hypothetical protein